MRNKRKNFWKLSNKRKLEVYGYAARKGWTWLHLGKNYKQPVWCVHPDALHRMMGCYTLVGRGEETRKCRNRCRTCPESVYYNGVSEESVNEGSSSKVSNSSEISDS